MCYYGSKYYKCISGTGMPFYSINDRRAMSVCFSLLNISEHFNQEHYILEDLGVWFRLG